MNASWRTVADPTSRFRPIVSSCVHSHTSCRRRAFWRGGWRGCASSDEQTKPVTYSLTAKQNYDKGLEELKDENYPRPDVLLLRQAEVPFSKYAVLAELALADTQFARGSYTEAIDSYKTFARLHPTHEKVEDGYVAYRICECYVQDMPTRLAGAAVLREGSDGGRDAHRELADFIDKYPDSKYLEDAQKLIGAR